MRSWRHVTAILRKDLLMELRTREMLTSMFLFVMLSMVVFHYAFGSETAYQADLTSFGGGLLWLAFLFTSMLGLNRALVHEKDQGCLDGLLLAPISRPSIYVAKMLGNLVLMGVVQVVALPIFTVFFIQYNYLPRLPWLILSILLADIGISAVGTLLSTMAVNTKARDLLLPIVFLPIIIPAVAQAVIATGDVMAGIPSLERVQGALMFLAVYDSIFLLLGYGLYDYVIGE